MEITIRPLLPSDAKDMYENIKDKEIVRWTLNIPHPYPKDGAKKFIQKAIKQAKKKEQYVFAIIPKDTKKLIGCVSLLNIDHKNKNAELGYWLGKRYWGKAITPKAVRLILIFGFKKLKLHKIYAKLFAANIPSRRVLEKSGFRLEGHIRQSRFRNNRWHDELRFGMLASEFKRQL